MNTKSTTGKTMGKGASIIMMLGFGLPGIGISYYLYTIHQGTEEQKQWPTAEVLTIDLPPNNWTDGFEDKVTYTYRYNDQDYTGIGVGGTRMEVNGTDRELHRWLSTTRTRQKEKSHIPCWVNPNKPTESTLIRRAPSFLSYFMGIFTLSHGLLGIGMFIAAWFGTSKNEENQENEEEKPEEIDTTFSTRSQRIDDPFAPEPKKTLGLTGKRLPKWVLLIWAIGLLFWSNAFLWPSLQMLQHKPSQLELPWAPTPGAFIPILVIAVSVALILGFIITNVRRAT